MTARRKALAAAAACALIAGGAAAWALAPGPASAGTPAITVPVTPPPRFDPWAQGPLDRDYMVQGILDDRSDKERR
jgi:hypothetical protein